MWLSGDFILFGTLIYMVPFLLWHLLAFLSRSIVCDVNNKTGFRIRLKDWIIIHAAGIELTTSNDL